MNNCREKDVCNMIISINVEERANNMNPIIELSIRRIDKIPFYISKGVVKQDFVSSSSWLNIFTTLGKNDEGYVTVNFATVSGKVYSKIVKFEREIKENPDWRGFRIT